MGYVCEWMLCDAGWFGYDADGSSSWVKERGDEWVDEGLEAERNCWYEVDCCICGALAYGSMEMLISIWT